LRACEEAITALRAAGRRTLPAFTVDKGLSLSAKSTLQQQSKECSTSSGDSLEKIKDFGLNSGEVTEISGYGARRGREFVYDWLIDDGDSSRARRKILLDPKWKSVGLGAGKHGSFRSAAILALASSFKTDEKVANGISAFLLKTLYSIPEPDYWK